MFASPATRHPPRWVHLVKEGSPEWDNALPSSQQPSKEASTSKMPSAPWEPNAVRHPRQPTEEAPGASTALTGPYRMEQPYWPGSCSWDTELPSVQSSGLQSDQGICPNNSKVLQEAQTSTDWGSDKAIQVSLMLITLFKGDRGRTAPPWWCLSLFSMLQ